MYVIKVGKYYVKSVDMYTGFINEIELSKEIMRGFTSLNIATTIAESINGEVIEMEDSTTNE